MRIERDLKVAMPPSPGKKKTSEKDKSSIKEKRLAVEIGSERDDVGNGLSGLGTDIQEYVASAKAQPQSSCSNCSLGSGVHCGSRLPKDKSYSRTIHCQDMKDLYILREVTPGAQPPTDYCGGRVWRCGRVKD